MRISDWSSDVCSSDLLDAHDLSRLVDEQHIQRDKRVLHQHGAHLRAAEQEQHAGVGRHLAAEHQALGALLAGLRNLRSAEHTSELQSLMRTSYAVIRLKTTNKHTYVKYTTTHKE